MKTRLQQKDIDELYFMMYLIDGLLMFKNIPYTVVSGSLLAASFERKSSFIDTDDDVDIGIIGDEHEYKIWELEEKLKEYGLEMTSYLGIIKIFPKNGKRVLNYKFPFLDIFILKENSKTGIYSMKGWYNQMMFGNEYFYPQELFPIKRYLFGNIYVNGPNIYKPYLDRTYGEDWPYVKRNNIIDHQTNMPLKKEEEKITTIERVLPTNNYIIYRIEKNLNYS